jgi:hypothetical protein
MKLHQLGSPEEYRYDLQFPKKIEGVRGQNASQGYRLKT